jgi:hypothetical protein
MLWAAGLMFGPALAGRMFLVAELAAAAKRTGLTGSLARTALATGIGFLAGLASAGIAFVLCHNTKDGLDQRRIPLRDNPQKALANAET